MKCNRPAARLSAYSLFATLACTLLACTGPPAGEFVWVRIPPGDSVAAVAESLAAHGVVRSAKSFERFARMGRKHLGIKPGVYPFKSGTPIGEVLVELRRGRPDAIKVGVKEGVWLAELFPELSRAFDIPMDELWEAARDSALLADVATGGGSIEGYLYPTTYYIPVGSSAMEVIRQMVDTFEAHWSPDWNARLDTLELSRSELVVLASIVEGEAPHSDDRPLVSSTYHNRLSNGMRLQADPTVVYALGTRRRLYNADYRFQSEYNTYRVNGLPPGPICQPGEKSLLAALYPPETDYYYFVADAAGRHQFTSTYREHLATVRKIRRSDSAR